MTTDAVETSPLEPVVLRLDDLDARDIEIFNLTLMENSL